MSTLQTIPNEIFIQITRNLCISDLKACRLVSSLMREKVDRLFTCNSWLVHFNEKSEREFIAKRKPALEIPIFFTRMKITGNVSYFLSNKNHPNKMLALCTEYFQNVTELEISEFIPKNYFHQIIELTRNLKILKLSSAVLGGSKNLFDKDAGIATQPCRSAKPKSMLFLRRALPSPIIQNLLDAQRSVAVFQKRFSINKWSTLQELHIKVDYICPGAPTNTNFSPHWLVENLKNVRNLPLPNLSVFNLKVEKDKDGDMFFFTASFLLNTIPVMAYPSLKTVSVVTPKCRPMSHKEIDYNDKMEKVAGFSRLQLNYLILNISEGLHNHAIPTNLMRILEAQRSQMQVSIQGIRNANIFMSMHE